LERSESPDTLDMELLDPGYGRFGVDFLDFEWIFMVLMVFERSESLGTLDMEDLERSGASGPWIPSF